MRAAAKRPKATKDISLQRLGDRITVLIPSRAGQLTLELDRKQAKNLAEQLKVELCRAESGQDAPVEDDGWLDPQIM